MLENLKNIKSIGLGIVIFEGSEHLRNIISELKEDLSYVVIALQDVSYHGQKISETDRQECYRLKDEGLVDEVIEVELDPTKEARIQETDKRNLLTEHIEKHGCSHALIIDSDEYYTRKSFERAVKEIDEHDYEITYCQYINYYHDYLHYLVYPFGENGGQYCPFVTKVKYRNFFECQDFPYPSDPTRRYVRPYDRIDRIKDPVSGRIIERKHYLVDYHIFEWNVVKMHHFSWLRENIRKKLNAWSSKKCFDNFDDLIDKAVDRFDNFNESTENESVDILFNTPNHQVKVARFPRQYVHPKYDYKTELIHVPSTKQILVVSESCDVPVISKMEETIRQTWGKTINEKFSENIKLIFIKASKTGKSYFDGKDTVYVNADDGLHHTFTKLGLGLKFINEELKLNYDYVVKTNTSTWLNIDMINKFISMLDNDDVIYGGEIMVSYWNFFRFFANGAFIILNKKLCNLMSKWAEEKGVYDYEGRGGFCDDLMISLLACNRFDYLKVDHTKHFTSVGLCRIMDADKTLIDKHPEWFNKMAIQIKTMNTKTMELDDDLRNKHDLKKMVYVDEVYHKNYEDKVDDLYQNMTKEIDTQYRLIPIDYRDDFYQKYTVEKRNFFKDYYSWPVTNKEESIKFMIEKNPEILIHKKDAQEDKNKIH